MLNKIIEGNRFHVCKQSFQMSYLFIVHLLTSAFILKVFIAVFLVTPAFQ